MALYQQGSQGLGVVQIQTRLQQLGLYAGPIDGEFGGGTEGVVESFRRANGPTVDARPGYYDSAWLLIGSDSCCGPLITRWSEQRRAADAGTNVHLEGRK